jgi:hypothetical protein
MKNTFLTVQEHELFGSSFQRYSDNPYTPIAVLEKEISVEECNKLRLEKKFLKNIPGSYWGKKYLQCHMSLEPLGLDKHSEHYGKTMRDPVLIYFSFYYGDLADLSDKFPYVRGNKLNRSSKN